MAKFTKLRDWRSKQGKTQQDVADEAGLTKATISRIETGGQRPTLDTAAKLSAITGIPAARFVMGEAGGKIEAAG